MTSSTVEQIKARLNIVDVVSSYLKLEKAGVNFKAKCPFHNEKTPSFFVSPTRETFHCFGCDRGGDLISFVQAIEGLSFSEALSMLADRAGIRPEKINYRDQTEKERLLELLDKATLYYEAILDKHNGAKDYLAKRGLTPKTIKDFRLGLAPADWQNGSLALIKHGFKNEEIEKAGLAVRVDAAVGRFYDRFRGRIMFPIFDVRGRVIGFSGRLFGRDSDQEAKYINTPATIVYDKSSVLYGLDRAKMAIRKAGACILVEGQMDLLLSHQVGLVNTVAVSGTALTSSHIKIISRLTDKIILAFDADLAGLTAGKKAVDLALVAGLDVNIAKLPAGQDPAEVISSGGEVAWKKSLNEAKHVINFYLEVLSEKYREPRSLAAAIRETVYPYIKILSHSIDQAYFISQIAALLKLPEEAVNRDFKEEADHHRLTDWPKTNQSERRILTKKEKIEEKIFGMLFWQSQTAKPLAAVRQLESELVAIYGRDNYLKTKTDWLKRKDELTLAAEILHEKSDDRGLVKEINELLKNLKLELLGLALEHSLKQLQAAEKQGDDKNIDKLLEKCHSLNQTINQLKEK